MTSYTFQLECSTCGGSPILHKGKCASCLTAERKAERVANQVVKKKKAIQKFSKKRKEENKEYAADAEQWFKDNPKCKARLEGCTDTTDHRHHLAGRGAMLNIRESFLPVCHSCHFQIHNVLSAKERRDRGLLISSVNLNRDIEKNVI